QADDLLGLLDGQPGGDDAAHYRLGGEPAQHFVDVVVDLQLAPLGLVVGADAGGDQDRGGAPFARLPRQAGDHLVEVLRVVGGELGEHLFQLAHARLAVDPQAGLDHRVDGGPPGLVGEHGRGEQRVVDVEENRVQSEGS